VDQTAHFYQVLHLAVSASPDEIRQAYVDLVRVWHPDRFAAEGRLQRLAEERLKEINEAYAALLSADQPGSGPLREAPAERPARFSGHASVFATPGLGFWLRALTFSAIILTFFFAAKTLLDALAAPFRHTGFLETDSERITKLLHFNPAAYGPDGTLPAGMERLANRTDRQDLREAGSRPRPNGHASIGSTVPGDENSVPVPGTGGMGEFQLHNETGLDCVTQVFNRYATGAALRAVYVRAGSETSIQNLRPGIYRLHVTFGRDWSQTRSMFARPDRDYWLGPFQFFETETAAERTGLRYNVSLRLPDRVP
jgi:DnaJ-like protein